VFALNCDARCITIFPVCCFHLFFGSFRCQCYIIRFMAPIDRDRIARKVGALHVFDSRIIILNSFSIGTSPWYFIYHAVMRGWMMPKVLPDVVLLGYDVMLTSQLCAL
jgi:hypothetical protein